MQSPKGIQLRKIVKNEFAKNRDVNEEQKLTTLKGNAIRALTNYLMLESSNKDKKFQEKITKFKNSEFDSIKSPPQI